MLFRDVPFSLPAESVLQPFLALPGELSAAEWTPAEKNNVQVVRDFCAAFPSHDLNRVMSFFAENCAYRIAETQEPNKARQSVTERIGF